MPSLIKCIAENVAFGLFISLVGYGLGYGMVVLFNTIEQASLNLITYQMFVTPF